LIEIITGQDLVAAAGVPMGRTTRSFAVRRDGVVLGVLGIYPQARRWIMFMKMQPGVCGPDQPLGVKRAFLKVLAHLLRIAKSRNMPVHAIADPAVKNSEVPLRHAGFRHVEGNLFEWT
jgi:hypothetical protein